MDKGMETAIVNIGWLAHELPSKPSSSNLYTFILWKALWHLNKDSLNTYVAEDNYPEPKA
jgi:hypothetical protein